VKTTRLAAQSGGDRYQDVLRSHISHIGSAGFSFGAHFRFPTCPPVCSCLPAISLPTAVSSFARDLQSKGDLVAAADLLLTGHGARGRISPRPGSRSAKIRLELGEQQAAISAFRNSRESDPDDRHGAALRLMRLGAEELSAMPRGYVQTLFDQYAPRFEASLLGETELPRAATAAQAVLAVRAAAMKPAFFKRAIDLGCGTGLPLWPSPAGR